MLLLAAQVNAEETLVLKTENEKVSYAIGVDTARSLKSSGIQADLDALITGMRDVFSGHKLLISETELPAVIRAYQQELNQGKGKKYLQSLAVIVGQRIPCSVHPSKISPETTIL